jgi:hypothetical protein
MNHDSADAIAPKRIDALSRQLYDELLVYDARTHRGHCLNQTAAAVWLACDGKTSIIEMVRRLEKELSVDVDEQIVWMTLDKLEKAGLLSEQVNSPSEVRLLSRREVVRKIGSVVAVALPIVTSIVVPPPAQAASCFPLLHSCSNNAQCCSGHCGVSGVSLVCLP